MENFSSSEELKILNKENNSDDKVNTNMAEKFASSGELSTRYNYSDIEVIDDADDADDDNNDDFEKSSNNVAKYIGSYDIDININLPTLIIILSILTCVILHVICDSIVKSYDV